MTPPSTASEVARVMTLARDVERVSPDALVGVPAWLVVRMGLGWCVANEPVRAWVTLAEIEGAK